MVDNNHPDRPLETLSKRTRTAALLLATGVAIYLCWLIVSPFLAVLTWALALAVVAHPWHGWLERRMRPAPAALVAVVSVAIALLGPGALVAQKAFQEANESLRRIEPELQADKVRSALQRYPLLANTVARLETNLDLDQEIRRAAEALAAKASALVGRSIWIITQLFLTLLTLFYFFRDRKRLLDFLRRFVPLTDSETTEVFDRVSHTINACLYGNVAVKLIQGLLGGLMFWILGLRAPVLCGVAMALLAALPIVGTALVWGPAAIVLALGGSWVKALILTVWGVLVVGLIDNILYPVLVAGELRFHTLAAFFSILGGLIAFGLAGIVLGPAIFAVTAALLEVWQVRKGEPADSAGTMHREQPVADG